jgi:hypothetical protein
MSIKFIFFRFFNFLPQTVKNDQNYIQTVKIVFKQLYLNLNRLIRNRYLTTVHRLQRTVDDRVSSSTRRRLQCELYPTSRFPEPAAYLEQLLRMLPQQAAEADVHDAVGGLLVQPRRDRLLVVHAGRFPARRRGPPPRPG